MRRSLFSISSFLALVALAGPITPLVAQGPKTFRSGMNLGAGYVGVIPEAVVGGGAFYFFGTSGIGVFADAKMTPGSLKKHENYCPQAISVCSVSWVESERNDFRLRVADEWLGFNVGAMYTLTPQLAVLGGAGLVRLRRFNEYFDDVDDPALRVTPTGNYYVDDEAGSGWKPQGVIGLMLRAGPSLAIRFGVESAIKGGSVGVYIVP